MLKYYPIINNLPAEIGALQSLKSESKEVIVPIIQSKRIKRSNLNHWWTSYSTLGNYLSGKIGQGEFIYDFTPAFDLVDNINEVIQNDNNQNLVEYCTEKMNENNLNYIPCVHYDSPDWLIDSVNDLGKEKLAIRVRVHNFSASLDQFVNQRIEQVIRSTSSKYIILILDFYNQININRVRSAIRNFSNMETELVISLTSCPEDLTMASPLTFSESTPRDDFNLFVDLLDEFPSMNYSDYTVRLSFEPEEGAIINYNTTYLKLIYTAEDFYMVGKSSLNRDEGVENFIDICQQIIEHECYSGSSFSDGDQCIKECANQIIEIRSHTTNIQIGVNHHIEFVVDQLTRIN